MGCLFFNSGVYAIPVNCSGGFDPDSCHRITGCGWRSGGLYFGNTRPNPCPDPMPEDYVGKCAGGPSQAPSVLPSRCMPINYTSRPNAVFPASAYQSTLRPIPVAENSTCCKLLRDSSYFWVSSPSQCGLSMGSIPVTARSCSPNSINSVSVVSRPTSSFANPRGRESCPSPIKKYSVPLSVYSCPPIPYNIPHAWDDCQQLKINLGGVAFNVSKKKWCQTAPDMGLCHGGANFLPSRSIELMGFPYGRLPLCSSL